MPVRAISLMIAATALSTTLTLTQPVSAAPSQTEPKAVELPAAIDATGTDDVTQELNEFFADLPARTTVTFPSEGEFRVEGSFTITERDRLTIEGNGATIFATTPGGLRRSHVSIMGGRDITIRDLAVEGSNPKAGSAEGAYLPEREGQHGFAARGTDGLDLDSVKATDVHGDFVYLGRSEDGRWTERAWIHDSTFTRNGRQGIAVVAGRDIVIERNRIAEVARSTIDLEPNNADGGVENIHVLDNEIGPGRLLFLAAAGDGPVDDVVVARNRMNNRSLTFWILPPDGSRRAGFWLLDNVGIAVENRTPIRAERIDGLVVLRNYQAVREGEYGVQADEVCGLLVSENDFGGQVQDTNPQRTSCGSLPDPEPPGPPDVLNRPTAQEIADALAAGSTTTAAGSVPGTAAAAVPQRSWNLTIAVGLLALVMVVAAVVTTRRARLRSRS